ncbi:unnamed protein product (macronuclear) [Paramecium tetraurelia]|uniref:VWFA domain-containing protein n=1 Tax=Paramecium tetraurelia TaxID=5888 RepID=A0BCR6_PARTE|nr:uncharacterized protein GSPATT00004427001 [Paramecium tetraurelia]CAK56333.1 unnamed protein product [Paramecium tetraurelia]|eukprot:XP_001423731.1 hypothetical protein (macronuclear) [Paramecium tetraurelia strain d4-2]
MSAFNKYYSILESNKDIKQQYKQNNPEDEIPEKSKQIQEMNNPIDIRYGYQDKSSLLFQINKKFPNQPDFKIGVDLIYLIDISQSLNDESLEKIKSALKCLVNYLSDQDRLCIVTYSNKACQLFPLIPLSEKNKLKIIKKIEQITIKKENSNIYSALQITLLSLELRQFKNEITNVNIISQDQDLRKYSNDFKEAFQNEQAFKLKVFLLFSQDLIQFCQKKKRESQKFGRYHIMKKFDQLSSLLCFETLKLQQTVILNLEIRVKTHQNNPIQISECSGGKFIYVSPYEIRIKKKLVSIGQNKPHLIGIGNIPKSEGGEICNIEVSFQQIHSNHHQNYDIPIYAQSQKNNILDETVMVQIYKLKSRSQMNEAMLYYDPYRIQDCIEILQMFQSEVADLPDGIKQQLNVEMQQFELALSQYKHNPAQQIENPFTKIDQQSKILKLKVFDKL